LPIEPDSNNPPESEIHRIAGNAVTDPLAALDAALALRDESSRRWAVRRIATAWSEIDPEMAFGAAARLPASLRKVYRRQVIEVWAELNSEACLAFLEHVDPASVPPRLDLSDLADADPGRLLAIASRLPPRVRHEFHEAALQALVLIDADATIAAIDSLTVSIAERDRLSASVAGHYVRADPSNGLAWAANLDPPVPEVLMEAVAEVAATDMDRAFALVTQLQGIETDVGLAFNAFLSALRQNPDRTPDYAATLATRDDARSVSLLAQLLTSWSAYEPREAFTWMLEHPVTLDSGSLGIVARNLSGQDLAMAVAAAARLPEPLQARWVPHVIGPYFNEDSNAALTWLDGYRGLPAYDYAVAAIARGLLARDPETLVRLVAGAGDTAQTVLIPQIARAWARGEPTAAAQWASGIPDEALRAIALEAINSAGA
jgi:hypothetical protein